MSKKHWGSLKGNVTFTRKSEVNPESKQRADKDALRGYFSPDPSFDALLTVYENSFIISGITEKIASFADSGFEELTDNPDPKLKEFLDSFDLKWIFLNMLVFGNCFIEKVLNGAWLTSTTSVEPFLTHTVYVKADGYRQIADGIVDFTTDEVMHFKRPSLRSKYIGDSLFSKCIKQITLLANIDKFYDKLFDDGLIRSSILSDETKSLTTNQLKELQVMIQDGMKWVDNAFANIVVPGKISKTDIGTDIDNQYFIELREALIKAIAIATNIPYGMLINDSSNRATSETELNVLATAIITPLQESFIKQLKRELKKYKAFNDKSIDELAFVPIDTKNGLVEMQTQVGYKNAGIITTNEVRKNIGYAEHPDGNELQTNLTASQTQEQIAKITSVVEGIYSKK